MSGYEIAESMLGLEEVRDRIELMDFFKQYAHKGDIVVDPKTTPWCACFVNACERAAGNEGTGKQNARSFLQYGNMIYDADSGKGNIKDGEKGDILIFSRGNSSWQGHVTYLDEIREDGFICLGGNQSDKVNRSFYPFIRLIGIRRPN